MIERGLNLNGRNSAGVFLKHVQPHLLPVANRKRKLYWEKQLSYYFPKAQQLQRKTNFLWRPSQLAIFKRNRYHLQNWDEKMHSVRIPNLIVKRNRSMRIWFKKGVKKHWQAKKKPFFIRKKEDKYTKWFLITKSNSVKKLNIFLQLHLFLRKKYKEWQRFESWKWAKSEEQSITDANSKLLLKKRIPRHWGDTKPKIFFLNKREQLNFFFWTGKWLRPEHNNWFFPKKIKMSSRAKRKLIKKNYKKSLKNMYIIGIEDGCIRSVERALL